METKNNTGLVVVVTILAMLVIGLTGFIVYDKIINKDSNELNNNSSISKIEVTSSLKQELRKLIPTVKYCNQYLYKQYNGNIFKNTDLTEEDRTSSFSECQGILGVYNLEYKYDSTNNEVYLYDYILIYDAETSFYGSNINKLDINFDDIEIINNKVSEESLKQHGQIYKYTFKLVNGDYKYVSTEAIFN